MTARRLFHITSATQVEAARAGGIYVPAAFAREGFIHCSYAHQIRSTANRIFRGQHGLVLLEIDPALLSATVRDENLEGGAELYPHIYGPLPLTAVCAVHPFPCESDGSFTPPAAVMPA